MIHLGRTENGEPVDTVPEELEEQRTNTDSAVSTAVALADDMARAVKKRSGAASPRSEKHPTT